MDYPFIYDRYVTGKNFIRRQQDSMILGNLLRQGVHVCFYDTAKSGKTSLLQHTLLQQRIHGWQFTVGQMSALNIRTTEQFLRRLGAVAIRSVASSPLEYSAIVEQYLGGTHFVFDREVFSRSDEILSLSWDIDETDIRAVLSLPQRLAADREVNLLLIIEEFQNLDFIEDSYHLFKIFESVIAEDNKGCTFIFSGSSYNAMKELFETKGLFYRRVEKFRLSPVDEKEIIDHVVKGFLSSGKVIDRDLLSGVCRMFRCNMFYINHFAAICDSRSKGYIMEPVLMDALGCLLPIHEPRFRETMNNLTTHQVNFLRAVIDGYKKFSTSEVIHRYALNSSANVKRVKDALMKKEILTFNDADEPFILDPLFEYWVKKYFFEV